MSGRASHPWKDSPPEPQREREPATTLIWGVWPLDLQAMNFCRVSSPLVGASLFQWPLDSKSQLWGCSADSVPPKLRPSRPSGVDVLRVCIPPVPSGAPCGRGESRAIPGGRGGLARVPNRHREVIGRSQKAGSFGGHPSHHPQRFPRGSTFLGGFPGRVTPGGRDRG